MFRNREREDFVLVFSTIMFEGFPFLYGEVLSYRAFFVATFLAASLYQLALLAIFRAASRAARKRSAARGRSGEAQRAYFEYLGEGGNGGRARGHGLGVSCARLLRRFCTLQAALSFTLFLLALVAYLVCVLLAFGHSSWAGRTITMAVVWILLSALVAAAQLAPGNVDDANVDATQQQMFRCTSPCLFHLAARTLLDFDARYVPLLAAMMLVSSAVSVSALGFLPPFWGVVLTYSLVAPFFYTWVRCCKCCTPRGDLHRHCCRERRGKSRAHTAFSMRFFDDAEMGGKVAEGAGDSEKTGMAVAKADGVGGGNISAAEMVALGSLSHKKDDDNINHTDNLDARSERAWSGWTKRSVLPTLLNQFAALSVAIALVGMTSGVCIGFFASNLSGIHLGPIIFSTSLTRALSSPEFGDAAQPRYTNCDWSGRDKKFCHLYLTLAENASSTIIVNAHVAVPTAVTPAGVRFAFCPIADKPGPGVTTATPSSCVDRMVTVTADIAVIDWIPDVETRRAVHSALLTPLQPDTRHAIWMLSPDDASVDGSAPSDLQFRSFPRPGAPITFVSGGDMGNTPESDAVSMAAAATSPSFAVVGGDIAYANDMPECISLWDAWLSSWQALMVTPAGDAIPILSACGNHDAGSNAGSRALETRFVDGKWIGPEIPFMFAFFPHRAVETGDERLRRPFHLHQVGAGATGSSGSALEVVVLDSGHVVEYDDPAQIDMLASLSARPAVGSKDKPACRVAVYHVPIFPSDDVDWDSQLGFMTAPRKFWLPEFQRAGISLAFENHVHTMKKTLPLLPTGQAIVRHVDNPASEGGTVYLGDGRWGIAKGGRDPASGHQVSAQKAAGGESVFESAATENHVWRIVVDAMAGQMNATAVGMDGVLSGRMWEDVVQC